MAFDDFGNALRRIREDFDVEIEIDVKPLKPDDRGLAQQHMVAGTIHYDRTNDKGILLYFKPNLTGDEPDDVIQYKTRYDRFPNETTVDQFYDEAQWESYRRLGEHAARSSLRLLERMPVSHRSKYTVFTEAFWRWYPTPPYLRAGILHQTARLTAVASALKWALLLPVTVLILWLAVKAILWLAAGLGWLLVWLAQQWR